RRRPRGGSRRGRTTGWCPPAGWSLLASSFGLRVVAQHGLLGLLGVGPHHLRHLLRVAGLERLDDRQVAAPQPAEVGAGDGRRVVGASHRLEQRPHPHQGAVAGGLHDPLVEGGVVEGMGVGVVGGCGLVHGVDQPAQLGQVVVGDPLGGPAGAQRLQLAPHGHGLHQLLAAGVANESAPVGLDLDDPDAGQVPQRLPHRCLADAEPPSHPGLDDAGPGRELAFHDPLEDLVFDLDPEDLPVEVVAAFLSLLRARSHVVNRSLAGTSRSVWSAPRISTTPVDPLTRNLSPDSILEVATDVPMTAGMPNSRARTAGWEAVPPASVTRPEIFVNSTTHAGLVIWQTRMSPFSTWSNSATDSTTLAVPVTTPGEAARPLTWSSASGCSMYSRSGNPHSDR